MPLDETEVRDAAQALARRGVEAIAVCFLFYLDPGHEERAAAIVREVYLQCFVTTSAAVSPVPRVRRSTTAAINAFVGPKVRATSAASSSRWRPRVARRSARDGLERRSGDRRDGRREAILTLLSGPAAGVLGGAWAGGQSSRRKLITFDVGGTSADIGIVDDGRIATATARTPGSPAIRCSRR